MAWRAWGIASLIVVLAGGAGLGGYAGVRHWRQPAASPSSSAPPPDRALTDATAAPASSSPAPAPEPSLPGLAAALRGPLADAHLGKRVLAEVRDAASGAVLFSRGATTPAAPASTAKLSTAIAVLAVHAASDRITTRVVAGAQPGTVVLVGGGDPTLTAAASGPSGPSGPAGSPGAARISDLARQLHGVRRVQVDGSLFTGPAASPYWAPEDIPSDYAAPVTAIMIDGGRDAPGDAVRSTAPDLAAGRVLAAALGVRSVVRAKAPAHARTLATVESPPIGTLVAQMLQTSDNVIAECLARQVALAEHQPASFTGAAAAVRAPDTLARLLLLATRRTSVLDMLPVAGWSGTLAGRYLGSAGAGVVRAKTGTLTGVSTLAGLVHDEDGRLLAFAVMADRVGAAEADTTAAEAALDRVAATLASCGCR